MGDDLLSSDAELFRAFRDGDRDALARVFRAYASAVARFARTGFTVTVDGTPLRVGVGLREADIENVVQDTFVRAFQQSARERYDGKRPFIAWLTTIARNLMIDAARKRRREVISLSEEVSDRMRVPAQAPEVVQRNEVLKLVEVVVEKLDDREKAVFFARFADGRSLRDTAAVLDLPLITVRRVDKALRGELILHLERNGYSIDTVWPDREEA